LLHLTCIFIQTSPFYDDNYAYSIYGEDAPSTVESLGVHGKVSDWMRDLHMPRIDEESGSIISDDLTNEEMLDHLYGYSTTTHKKQLKRRVSEGSADSGIGSENGNGLSQKDSYITEQRVEELLHSTTSNEGEVSPHSETASLNEGDGQGNSRPSSLSSFLPNISKHNQDAGNPTAVDTLVTPTLGSIHENTFPKSRKFTPLVINRLPSVSDSVFTNSLSEGNYVDHRIASTSDSGGQSPNFDASVGKTSPGFENISTPSCFVHDFTPHNAFSSHDRCETPTITGVYKQQNIAAECVSVENAPQSGSSKSEVTHTFLPHSSGTKTVAVKEATAILTPRAFPFHITPIKETSTMPLARQYNSGTISGNYVSRDIMFNDENIIFSADCNSAAKDKVYNETPFPSKAYTSHISISQIRGQHTTVTDGVYLPHNEDTSDVNRVTLLPMSEQYNGPNTQQYTSSKVNDNHTMDSFQHITPLTGVYMPYNAAVEDFQDTASQTSNTVPKSNEPCSVIEVENKNLSCYDQHSTSTITTGLYVPCSTAVDCDQLMTLNETSSYHLQQSHDQECVSATTTPVALHGYVSHNVVTSNEDAEMPTNAKTQEHDDDVSMSDRCDTPITGMYMAYSDSVEDTQVLTDCILAVSQKNKGIPIDSLDIHYASTNEDKVTTDLSTSSDHLTVGQYVPYTTALNQNNSTASNGAQFNNYQDSNVALGNYVSNETIESNQEQLTSFDVQYSDHFIVTTMHNSCV